MIETCLHPGHTFDQFACGNCNQLAFSSAEQVAEGSIPLLVGGVADFMSNMQTECIRDLEGLVIRLGTYSSLQNTAVTLSIAKHYLKPQNRQEADEAC